MTAAFKAYGLSPARIHTEAFGPEAALTPGVVTKAARAPHQPARAASGELGSAVSFARSGLTVPWHPDYGTLLELAEACDVPVRWSCRTGVCHTCETALLAGRVALTRTGGTPRRRKRAHLLLHTNRGPRAGHLTGRSDFGAPTCRRGTATS